MTRRSHDAAKDSITLFDYLMQNEMGCENLVVFVINDSFLYSVTVIVIIKMSSIEY